MLVADLLRLLDRVAPFSLAEPGDNCGLLVGDDGAGVCRVLASLELTEPVLEEALAGGFDTVLTHHPLLFSPVRSLVETHSRERLLRRLIAEQMTLIACHTNLDSAPGGLADIAGVALDLQQMVPLQCAAAGWYKLVGFVPSDAVDKVAAAVFATGAGRIGQYEDCAFSASGTGWFTARPGSHPTVGKVAIPERTPEIRWETVIPRGSLAGAIRAFVQAHPYEEPAFDVYPVEDVVAGAGLGRVGVLAQSASVRVLAERAAQIFEVAGVSWSGDGDRSVRRVGVLPGSGRSLLDAAQGQCEVLLTGDVGYHAADAAAEMGLALIDLPHGELEWWAFRRWAEGSDGDWGRAGSLSRPRNSGVLCGNSVGRAAGRPGTGDGKEGTVAKAGGEVARGTGQAAHRRRVTWQSRAERHRGGSRRSERGRNPHCRAVRSASGPTTWPSIARCSPVSRRPRSWAPGRRSRSPIPSYS